MADGTAYRDVILRIKAEADPGIDRAFTGIASRTDNHIKAVERAWSTMLGSMEQKTIASMSRIEAAMARTAQGVNRFGGGGGVGVGVGGGSGSGGGVPMYNGAPRMGGGGRQSPIIPRNAGGDGYDAMAAADEWLAGERRKTEEILERSRRRREEWRQEQRANSPIVGFGMGMLGGLAGANGAMMAYDFYRDAGKLKFDQHGVPTPSALAGFLGGGNAWGDMKGGVSLLSNVNLTEAMAKTGRLDSRWRQIQLQETRGQIEAAGQQALSDSALQRQFALNANRFDGSTGGQLSRNEADLASAREKSAMEEIIRLEQERMQLVQRRAQEQIAAADRSLRIAEREKAEVEATLERRKSQIAGAAEAFGFADPVTQNAARSAADKLKNGLGASLTRDELAAAQGLRGAIPGIDEALEAEGRRRADLAGFRGIEGQFGIPKEIAGLEGEKARLELEIKNQGEIKVKLEEDAKQRIEAIQESLRPILEDFFDKRDAALLEEVNKALNAIATEQQGHRAPGRQGG